MFRIIDDALVYALLGLLAGSIFFILDRVFGAGLYRWQHNLRHKDPLDPTQEKGLFIYGRSVHLRFWFATIVIVGHFFYYLHHGAGFASQMVLEVAAFFGLFFGLYAGPYAYKLWGRRRAGIQVLDDLGTGKINVKEKAGRAIKGAMSTVGQTATTALKDLRTAAAPPKADAAAASEVPQAVKEAPPPKASEPTPDEVIRTYINGGRPQ